MTAILRYPFTTVLSIPVKMALTCFAGAIVLAAFAAKSAIEICATTKQSNH